MNRLKGLADRLAGRSRGCDMCAGRLLFRPRRLLNQNARASGAAVRPAALTELVAGLFPRAIGIMQMPCPKLCAFGLDRAGRCIERELRTAAGRLLSRELARDEVRHIRTYRAAWIRVLRVLGKNGSPSCGVEETWPRGVCPGSGVFIEALAGELRGQGLRLGSVGIRDADPAGALTAADRRLAAQGAS